MSINEVHLFKQILCAKPTQNTVNLTTDVGKIGDFLIKLTSNLNNL
jgi:hypothetical protein